MLGICLPECLPLCYSEGGRGWACGCLGRATPARDTRPAPVWLQTHYFTSTIHLTFKLNMRHHFPSMGKTREVRHGSRVSREWAWLETDLKVV